MGYPLFRGDCLSRNQLGAIPSGFRWHRVISTNRKWWWYRHFRGLKTSCTAVYYLPLLQLRNFQIKRRRKDDYLFILSFTLVTLRLWRRKMITCDYVVIIGVDRNHVFACDIKRFPQNCKYSYSEVMNRYGQMLYSGFLS